MKPITPEQQLVLEQAYRQVVATGSWPNARQFRLELLRSHKILLDTVGFDTNPAVFMPGDYTTAGAPCILNLPALQYIDGAASDRAAIGRIVEWIVTSYVEGNTTGITREILSSAIDSDLQATSRALGFMQYLGGLVRPMQRLGEQVLGLAVFDIDDDAPQFLGVRTYEGLLERLDQLQAERLSRYSGSKMSFVDILGAPNDDALQAAVAFPTHHPAMGDKVQALFANRHFGEAVQCAFAEFEAAVQDRAGLPRKSGLQLMAAAFGSDKGRPLLSINDGVSLNDISEQQGLKLLAMGAMAFARNPQSHASRAELEEPDTLEMLGLASLLYRQLDRARPNV